MKKFCSITTCVLATCLGPSSVPASGMLYVSNIDRPSEGVSNAASDIWLATSFKTGSSPGGYLLDFVQLSMAAPSGQPSGFSVSIYQADPRYPTVPVAGFLSGPDPLEDDVFMYNASDINLSSSTRYFVVATADTPTSIGSFSWSYADNSLHYASGGWEYGPYSLTSIDGENWARDPVNRQLAISASPVPEPTSSVLLGLGGFVLLLRFFGRLSPVK